MTTAAGVVTAPIYSALTRGSGATMTTNDWRGELVAAIATHDTKAEEFGTQVGKLYTDKGLPIDMALDRIDWPKERKIVVLQGALDWLIEHKRNSGGTEKSIERQRKTNAAAMERFINGGETGMY